MESDISIVLGATSLKSFTVTDTIFGINKTFRNNFLQKYIQQAKSIAIQHIAIKGFDLSQRKRKTYVEN